MRTTHVAGDRVRDGRDGSVPIVSLVVRPQAAAAVRLIALLVLRIVEACRAATQLASAPAQTTREEQSEARTHLVRLPRLDNRAGDWPALGVGTQTLGVYL
jgi:hypothetical protein